MPRDRLHKSRRSTPWMGREKEMSPAEKMIHYNYLKDHETHHPPIGDDLEVQLINLSTHTGRHLARSAVQSGSL